MRTVFHFKRFTAVVLITSAWIHLSEVFRYFVLVIPRTKLFFGYREGIAEMNWTILLIWGLWDTLLTAVVVFMFWLYAQTFGHTIKSVLISATVSWLFFFVLFWVGNVNMGTADWNILWITLPLSWFELFVTLVIASRLYKKQLKTKLT